MPPVTTSIRRQTSNDFCSTCSQNDPRNSPPEPSQRIKSGTDHQWKLLGRGRCQCFKSFCLTDTEKKANFFIKELRSLSYRCFNHHSHYEKAVTWARVLSKLDKHENIVQTLEFTQDPIEFHLTIKQEFIEGDHLLWRINEKVKTGGCFTERQVAWYTFQIANAVSFLQKHKPVALSHGNLTPKNIFFKMRKTHLNIYQPKNKWNIKQQQLMPGTTLY